MRRRSLHVIAILCVAGLALCLPPGGCATDRDARKIDEYGGLFVPVYEGPWVNGPPVDYIRFDPAKRVLTDDDFAAVFPHVKRMSPYRLYLRGHRVSDGSVDLINQLRDLRLVDLRDTDVTPEGLRRLRVKQQQ